MYFLIVLLFHFYAYGHSHPNDKSEQCIEMNCIGEGYECFNNFCYCASGYVVDDVHNTCVKCPGLGDKCFRTCCNSDENVSLYCWQGTCRNCYDANGNWICREPIDQVLIVSISQIAMATALVLGILATFVLLYKLCSTTEVRALSPSSRTGSRLSIGSLQIYVNERLRDAPPRYSRTAPATATVYPAACNAGFVHDSTVPPPPYTPSIKNIDSSHSEIHM